MAAPRVVGPHGGQLVSLGGPGARFPLTETMPGIVSLSWSTLCYRTPWLRPCIGIIARTNTISSSREALERCSAIVVAIGNPGDLIFKPRNQWHTSWNAGDAPARISESFLRPSGSATALTLSR